MLSIFTIAIIVGAGLAIGVGAAAVVCSMGKLIFGIPAMILKRKRGKPDAPSN